MQHVLKSVLTGSFVACLAVVTAGCPAEAPVATPTPESSTTTPETSTSMAPADAGETPMMAPETGSGTGSGAAVP